MEKNRKIKLQSSKPKIIQKYKKFILALSFFEILKNDIKHI